MDAATQLKQEKNQLLAQIAEAAKEGKSDAILAASAQLEKVEALLRRYDQLAREVTELKATRLITKSDEAARDSTAACTDNLTSSSHGISPRAHGRELREAFLSKLA
jgi:alanyl-tRNA synthetase